MARARADYHKRLDAFIDEVLKHEPKLEDGDSMSIKFTGGIDSWDDDNRPNLNISITTERHENCV